VIGKITDHSGWYYCLLGGIIAIGLWVRFVDLFARFPDGIRIAGSALEYQILAEHILHPGLAPPPGNPLGFSLLLALFFAILPFSPATIQIWTTISASLGMGLAAFFLARKFIDAYPALVIAGLVVMNQPSIHNCLGGTTEELFGLNLLAVVLIYLSLQQKALVPWFGYGLLALSVCSLVLVRKDGFFIIPVLFLSCFWSSWKKEGLLRGIQKTGIILFLPLFLLYLAGIYQESQGIKSSYWRGARAFLWYDFFRGRMPWDYLFYAKVNLVDWWFGMHSLKEMLAISLKSSIRTVLSIGEALGGQLVLVLGVWGMVSYLREKRDWVFPLVVPLSILPQFLWIVFSSEGDMYRYIVRVLPLMFVFVGIGGFSVGKWMLERYGRSLKWEISLPKTTLAVIVFCLLVSRLPFSIYQAVLPRISSVKLERHHTMGQEIHPSLVDLWKKYWQREIPEEEAKKAIRGFLGKHPTYAPIWLVSGLASLDSGDIQGAEENLEKATEIVPLFAEAGILLGEVYTLQGKYQQALSLLGKLSEERSDYPPLFLLQAKLFMHRQLNAEALAAYERYFEANREQSQNALERTKRILQRSGDVNGIREIERQIRELKISEVVLTSLPLWDYLSLGLRGIGLPVPYDKNVCNDLGLVNARLGNMAKAEISWKIATEVNPLTVEPWNNLGLVYAKQEKYDQAERVFQEALRKNPDSLVLKIGLGRVFIVRGDCEKAKEYFGGISEEGVGKKAVEKILAQIGQREKRIVKEEIVDDWDFLQSRTVLPMSRAILPAVDQS